MADSFVQVPRDDGSDDVKVRLVDNGDGTFSVATSNGVDGNDSVTILNGAGASAVNIQDGGNSITVDGNEFDIRNLSALTDTVGIGVQQDIFGHVEVVQPYNQVEMRLDDTGYASFIDTTTANGGSVSQSSGLVSITTGTNTAGSSIIASKDTIEYRPGVGIFGAGTAVFTSGASGCNQRVGLSDNTNFDNSVTFGYENSSFGIRYTRGGSQVAFVAQSSWDDPCDGVASGSLFTRDGVKEVLDPTKGNLYRVLAGLFGFAGFVCQVWSPDNKWITVYTYKHINSGSVPVFNTNSLKVILAASKSSGASSFVLKSQCWAGGTGSSLERIAATLTDRKLAQTVRSVLAAKMPSGSYTNIDATTGGNLKVALEEIDPAVTLPLPTGASTSANQTTANSSLSSIDTKTPSLINGRQPVDAAGDVTHDAVDSGNPVKQGAKATTGLHSNTMVANNDRTDLFAGIDGVQIVREHSNLESTASGTMSNTDGASTAMTGFAAAGVGVKWYVTDVIMSNSSSTNITVDLRDGTAGSVKATFPVPAGGGVVHRFAVPIAFTANTAVAIDASAATTTLNVTLCGFKSKV